VNLSTNPDDSDYCYRPCDTGVHVCGLHPDGRNFLTVANFPITSRSAARALFRAAKAELAAADGELFDLVVDLQLGGECDTDFPMTRQMLARLEQLAAAGGRS
jgi:hypothetical protein